jgi:hypothetical protein
MIFIFGVLCCGVFRFATNLNLAWQAEHLTFVLNCFGDFQNAPKTISVCNTMHFESYDKNIRIFKYSGITNLVVVISQQLVQFKYSLKTPKAKESSVFRSVNIMKGQNNLCDSETEWSSHYQFHRQLLCYVLQYVISICRTHLHMHDRYYQCIIVCRNMKRVLIF